MLKKANLLSLSDANMSDAKVLLEEVLDIKFIPHESEYHGGDYFKTTSQNLNIVLKANFIEDDGETTEAECPDAMLLLYINGDEIGVDKLSEKVANHGFKLRRASMY